MMKHIWTGLGTTTNHAVQSHQKRPVWDHNAPQSLVIQRGEGDGTGLLLRDWERGEGVEEKGRLF